MPATSRKPHALVLAGSLLLLTACQQAPITGRRQLILISPEQEMELGTAAYREVIEKSKLSKDQRLLAILRRVGERIAAKAHEPDYQWEFNLIESDQANAFALPGGKVAVYTGILPVCRNEAGLAAVIAHEVGHVLARHGAERISQGMVVDLVGTGIEYGIRGADPQARAGIMVAYGAGATLGLLLPYSRKHESEADEIGIRLMARAGYDPAEAVALWERMARLEKERPPEFLSTHPDPGRRAARLRALLGRMRMLYEGQPEKYGSGERLPLPR